MELIQVGEKTYYIKNPTNIGIYRINEKEVYLIDAGNDKDTGKKILKIIEEQGWHVKGILLTHSHADHIGGAKIIEERTQCSVYAYDVETSFTKYPILEPSLLYGGYPFKALQNKFLLAKGTRVIEIDNNLPEGIEMFSLKGHFFSMVGFKTSDNIYFLGDSIFSEETINKYHLFYIYDVKEYLNTLDFLNALEGNLYIPSHVEATENIQKIVKDNRSKIEEIINKILKACEKEKTFEMILKSIFTEYNLTMNENQYVLIGSTIKSYLSYLCDEGKIIYSFKENQMFWKRKE